MAKAQAEEGPEAEPCWAARGSGTTDSEETLLRIGLGDRAGTGPYGSGKATGG